MCFPWPCYVERLEGELWRWRLMLELRRWRAMLELRRSCVAALARPWSCPLVSYITFAANIFYSPYSVDDVDAVECATSQVRVSSSATLLNLCDSPQLATRQQTANCNPFPSWQIVP
jgi:hypothetical protein